MVFCYLPSKGRGYLYFSNNKFSQHAFSNKFPSSDNTPRTDLSYQLMWGPDRDSVLRGILATAGSPSQAESLFFRRQKYGLGLDCYQPDGGPR
jgi:hypothetical protein